MEKKKNSFVRKKKEITERERKKERGEKEK